MRRWMFGFSALVGSTAIVTACGVGSDCDFGLCDGPLIGTDSGEGGADVVPAGCNPDLEPRDAPLCVVDSFGVFVAPDGKPDALGTRDAPVNSIANALKVVANKPRIYVCSGTYPEKIELSVPVSIYGGFACGTWLPNKEKPVFAAASAGDYALRVRGVAGEITIADIEASAKPGDQTHLSSIAAFVSDSPKLTLRRVALNAGAAQNGGGGVAGVKGTPTPLDLNGNNPNPAAVDGGKGGAAKSCTCSSGGSSKGGRGGDTIGVLGDGEAGETAMAMPDPATATGAGQTTMVCQAAGLPPRPGSNAPAGKAAEAPVGVGDLTGAGWLPGDGAPGIAGKPGQGGGGAGGNPGGADPGGGGGGACGGCGGTAGGGGMAGGSSVALLALNSEVKLEGATLTASKAGNGGTGATGGGAQSGGSGGARVGSCAGAAGGAGGAGGAGAGGSGGISAGILHKGGAPHPDPATEDAITIGAPGSAGPGGIPSTNDGKPGDAKKAFAL